MLTEVRLLPSHNDWWTEAYLRVLTGTVDFFCKSRVFSAGTLRKAGAVRSYVSVCSSLYRSRLGLSREEGSKDPGSSLGKKRIHATIGYENQEQLGKYPLWSE